MSIHCFWILNDGTIVEPNTYHILAVVSAPGAFGEDDETILQSFAKYGQNPISNIESRARAEVMKRVIRRGHIRVRKNQYRKKQQWSLQLHKLNEQREAYISAWARWISATVYDPYADVIIHQLKNNSTNLTSLDLLAAQYPCQAPPRVITQSELVSVYV